MRKYLNGTSVPLSMAVFLANDTYDHDSQAISATALLKPIRQTILSKRVPAEDQLIDIIGLTKSRVGTAIHDSIERAWIKHYDSAMEALGYPEKVRERIAVNPSPHEITDNTIPVYLEKRSHKQIMGYTISGKFDFVAEGRVEDFKTTSVNTWINGTKVEDYQLQGSIYRWLNPDIITDDHMAIQFLFTDWMPGRAKADPKYPQKPVQEHLIPLIPIAATEAYIRNRITEFQKYENTPEEDLPLCSDKELWRSAPTYKYYKNPAKKTRSTKNFDNKEEAYLRLAQDGNVGVVDEVPGQVVACKYCNAYSICKQKDALIADGSLIV